MFGILKPDITLELDEGEHILHYTRRHWVVLLARVGVPLLLAVLTLGLALYRAIGGVFFAAGVGPQGRLVDLSNLIFLALIAGAVFWWVRRSSKRKKGASGLVLDALVVLGVLAIGLMIYFRYQGGRVFYVDPAYERGDDVFNIALVGLGMLLVGATIYIIIDWANDFLILTNTRVVVDDVKLLVRHVTQQILIDNIQQVSVSADSYVAHFLGHLTLWRCQLERSLGRREEPPPDRAEVAYGKLIVGSLSFRKLVFDYARAPVTMQQKINGELGKLRKQQEPETLRQIIEEQVYDGMRPKARSSPIHVVEHHGPMPWLFETNPEINHKTEEIVWRPYWIFLLLDMLPAIGIVLVATFLVIFGFQLGLLSAAAAFWIWLLVALACLARIIWVREEHANDKYILQRDKIIDVDKKPFGPESSRVAPLGNVQDVQFDQSFVENLLGYGDVTITTGGGAGNFTFKHVPDPRNVQATINDYLTDFRKREKERAQQATIALLKQFRAAQRDHGELLNDQQIAAVAEKVNEMIGNEVPAQVEREVASQVPDAVRRQVDGSLRRELWRTGLFRRRRS
jgi:hypothetical protein